MPTEILVDPLLRARVLDALRPCGDYWLDSETLLIQLNLRRPGVQPGQLRACLEAFREKAYVDFRVDEISGLTEWRLTPSGRQLARRLA